MLPVHYHQAANHLQIETENPANLRAASHVEKARPEMRLQAVIRAEIHVAIQNENHQRSLHTEILSVK
jgi:hypothetical protein